MWFQPTPTPMTAVRIFDSFAMIFYEMYGCFDG
jgi:hypothetical protein